MIRLAISGDVHDWEAIALRLRGAMLVGPFVVPPSGGHDMDCDAMLLVNATPDTIPVIQQCLTAGRHVLVTAARWLSGPVLDSLSATASRVGVQFGVVNPDQFLPSRQLVRQHLDSGKLGTPGLIRIHRWEASDANQIEPSDALPSPVALDLELAMTLAGSPPTRVYATEALLANQPKCSGRTIQVHLEFTGGTMALIDYSSALPGGAGYQSLSVIGSAGASYADDHQNMQLLYQGDLPRAARVEESLRQRVNLAQDFVDALLSHRDLAPGVALWRYTLTVVEAVEQLLDTRKALVKRTR